jgi:hypothetical protein
MECRLRRCERGDQCEEHAELDEDVGHIKSIEEGGGDASHAEGKKGGCGEHAAVFVFCCYEDAVRADVTDCAEDKGCSVDG